MPFIPPARIETRESHGEKMQGITVIGAINRDQSFPKTEGDPYPRAYMGIGQTVESQPQEPPKDWISVAKFDPPRVVAGIVLVAILAKLLW